MPDQGPRWRFARMTPSQMNEEPVQGEFFTSASSQPAERLVREAIQNSLDARDGTGTVRVRFAFSGDDGALGIDAAQRYLVGLREHIEAVADAEAAPVASSASGALSDAEESAIYDARSTIDNPMTYLAVEDFGTTGLQGSVSTKWLNKGNLPDGVTNDFWGFFRSNGISPKGADAGGSWGLGKWVFPDASIINSYLGVTQRKSEDRYLLMGMAMLRTHHIGEGDDPPRYPSYGYFAAHSDDGDEQWFPLPVDSNSDPDSALTVLDDFNLERLDGPGLSVVVPYPKKELTGGAIARAVITQYFLPIVRNDLEVEITEGERAWHIDAASIDNEVDRIEPSNRDDETPESLRKVIELARWAMRRTPGDHIEAPADTRNKEAIEEYGLDDLRQRFDRGERLAFTLTTRVRRRNEDYASSAFHVYLERDEKLDRGHDYFVRGHLRIPGMDYIREHRARALVFVDGSTKLGDMLRDSEGPAHNRWDPEAKRLTEHWVAPRARVREVRSAAGTLLRHLFERPQERQTTALSDIFPARAAASAATPPNTASDKAGSGRTEKPDIPVLPRSAADIGGVDRGFRVRTPASRDLTGTSWRLTFAYDVLRGNPFTKFKRGKEAGYPDFLITDLQVDSRGCKWRIDGDNAMRVDVTDSDFGITVTGFDHRDVVVDLTPVSDAADAGGEE